MLTATPLPPSPTQPPNPLLLPPPPTPPKEPTRGSVEAVKRTCWCRCQPPPTPFIHTSPLPLHPHAPPLSTPPHSPSTLPSSIHGDSPSFIPFPVSLPLYVLCLPILCPHVTIYPFPISVSFSPLSYIYCTSFFPYAFLTTLHPLSLLYSFPNLLSYVLHFPVLPPLPDLAIQCRPIPAASLVYCTVHFSH